MSEKTRKIAVVTNDGRSISAHFGRAKTYVIFTLEDGEIINSETVEKPAHGNGHHHHDDEHANSNVTLDATPPKASTTHLHNHNDMFTPLQEHGVEVVLSRGMGYGAHNGLTMAGIVPIITDIVLVDEALAAFIQGTIVDHPEKLH